MMLADESFVVAEFVEQFDQSQVSFERKRRDSPRPCENGAREFANVISLFFPDSVHVTL